MKVSGMFDVTLNPLDPYAKGESGVNLGPVDTNLIVTVEPEKAPIKARGVQFGRSK